MTVLKCKMCGGDLNVLDEQTVCECEYCGTRQTVPKADDEKKLKLFARAGRLLRACEFDKAAGVYEAIVADFDQEAEAYWGLILCKYGIEYVDDPATGKKIPTCHRSSFDGVLDDANFELVMENADAISRPVYRAEAKEIERLRKGILEVSAQEEPYDVFICYKETDEQGDRTVDSLIAQDVYTALTERGYRVFFSRISLEDKLGQEYEPYIFAALHSARVMLAFGTSYENYDAVWVKNEWSRFLSLMARGEKKTLIPCYKDLDAYDMPKEFQRLQAQDMGKVGALQDLIRGVEKIIGKKAEPTQPAQQIVQQIVQGGGPNVAALLERGNMALEDQEWEKAKEYFDQVLSMDAKCGEAYLGLAMAEARTMYRDAFAKAYTEADFPLRSNEDKNIIRARQFDQELDAWFSELDKNPAVGLDRWLDRQGRHKVFGKENEQFLTHYMVRNGVLERRRYGSISVAIIPEGIRAISKQAFVFCRDLCTVSIPASVEEIGEAAFLGCESLQSVTISEGVISINDYAFCGCKSLKEITIPKSVTTIGKSAFSGCALESIVVPSNVKECGPGAFSNCSMLSAIHVDAENSCYREEDGIVFSKDNAYLVSYPAGKAGAYRIPETVSAITEAAFCGAHALNTLWIPEHVNFIAADAFVQSGLRTIEVDAANPCFKSEDGILFTKEGSQLLLFPPKKAQSAYSVPVGVTIIGDHAFHSCSSLTDVTLPQGVTRIGNSAFRHCSSLTSVTLPEGVTSIEELAFAECESLKYITLLKGIISIGKAAFQCCKSLEEITLPEGLTSIGEGAFYSCISVERVIIPKSVTSIGDHAFHECGKLRIYADTGSYATEYVKNNQYVLMTKAELDAEQAAEKKAEAERKAAAKKAEAERKVAEERAEAQRRAAAERAVAQRRAKIDALNEEKANLQTELANLRGLFSGKRRRELEAQIAQADEQLAALQAELKSLE